MTERSESSFVIGIAMAGSVFTMAYQVAGKAARDALFLSNFGARHLPAIVISAALTAILLGVLNSRLLSKFPPRRFIPMVMIGSAALQVLEWFAYQSLPQLTAVVVYIHVVALGAVITSGFWSVINEQMDPYTAKRSFARIAAAGTAGGIAGGLTAERLGAMTSIESVLLFLCAAQTITALLLGLLPGYESTQERLVVRARDVLRGSAYLRNISYLVVLGTFSAALLDYVLKAQARHSIGPGEPLLRFFALFHSGTAVLSFLLQITATSTFLARWGLGATISTLPAAVTGGGVVALLTGGLPIITIVRGLEAVVRGSLFRAGYELFYTPMLAPEKRALKSINDVTVDRLGDGLGGGFAQAVISGLGSLAEPVMVATAAIASGVSWMIAKRLNYAYVKSLERSLQHRAVELDLLEDDARVAEPVRISLLDTIPMAKRVVATPAPESLQPNIRLQWMDILSGDRVRIQTALAGPPLERALLPFVIPLLSRKSVSGGASRALEAVAEKNIGQLSDYLLDSTTPVQVRCRLPMILAASQNLRAADALVRGLGDRNSEVRYQCGRALDALRQTSSLHVEAERMYPIIERELAMSPDLEHVFLLLGVVLPREPVRAAFEALTTNDLQLRGLGLEYLESALPADIAQPLLSLLERGPAGETGRASGAIREDLLRFLDKAAGRSTENQ